MQLGGYLIRSLSRRRARVTLVTRGQIEAYWLVCSNCGKAKLGATSCKYRRINRARVSA
jgi:hypothetical protein